MTSGTSVCYIVQAARTAVGRRNGSLAGTHAVTLAAHAIDGMLNRADINPALVDDVILGVVSSVGEQSCNVARQAVLASDLLPESVPGTTVDRQCGSSQQAIHFAAQAVMSGTQDVVIAGGVESMSRVPMFSNLGKGAFGWPNDARIERAYPGSERFFSQFVGAELLAERWDIHRADLDAYATRSHARAARALAARAFEAEIVPIDVVDAESGGATRSFAVDEGVRPGTTEEKLAALEPISEGGMMTAGNASQISDGAAALLVCNEAGLAKLKLNGTDVTPVATVRTLALGASDPVEVLGAPIPATRTALEKAGLTIEDFARDGLVEINEAFSCVPLAWQRALGLEDDTAWLNANGGAVALGHPLGATGAKLMTTLLHALVREDKRLGLLAICEGGGTANATIVERC